MGYIRHHAIMVTTWDENLADQAHVEACRLFGQPLPHAEAIARVSPIMVSPVNSDYSFCVFPDGSKEGWDHSAAGDTARSAFLDWLNGQRYKDNSSPFDWAEVQYGDDEGESLVTRHSDEVEILA